MMENRDISYMRDMHEVTAAACIKWAYDVQDSQIARPAE
jgi:hypothetical protein